MERSSLFVEFENDVTGYEMEKLLRKYDDTLFYNLQRSDYDAVADCLSDFCYDLIHFPEELQLFIARTYFNSIITEVIRVQLRKHLLHGQLLTHSFTIIARVEKWQSLTEFLLEIPWFIERLQVAIIAEYTIIRASYHVETALKLIADHIKQRDLSVGWLAAELDITPTHLANLFKIEVGEAVSLYIAQRKLREITYEILFTSKSIHAIREEYGFTNHSNFIQFFKRHVGMTPLQYKRSKMDRNMEFLME